MCTHAGGEGGEGVGKVGGRWQNTIYNGWRYDREIMKGKQNKDNNVY
jgi:hypothetical protein